MSLGKVVELHVFTPIVGRSAFDALLQPRSHPLYSSSVHRNSGIAIVLSAQVFTFTELVFCEKHVMDEVIELY